MNIENSRERYQILLGRKGDFMYDIQKARQRYGFNMDSDSFSIGQLQSKRWAVDVMRDVQRAHKVDWGLVYNLCGWYGVLSAMMFYEKLNLDKIRSFDIDSNCEEIADAMNKTNYNDEWRFKAITGDIFNINFEKHTWQAWSKSNERLSKPITESPNTLINLSCEHTIPSWFNNVPDGMIMVLQSNNFLKGDDHINCSEDIEYFKKQFPLTEIYYDGQIKLPLYTRFMLIGVK